MNAVEIWNQAVELSGPTVAQLKAIGATSTRPVFDDETGLNFLAPNVLFQTTPGWPAGDESEVINLILVFRADYFRAATNPGIIMTDVEHVSWFGLPLPCPAQEALEHLQRAGIAPSGLVTDSDEFGAVTGWIVKVGALRFQFQPNDEAGDPRRSTLAAVSFGFRLRHRSDVTPSLTVARPRQAGG